MAIMSCGAVIKRKVNADTGRLKVSSSVCEGRGGTKEVEIKRRGAKKKRQSGKSSVM